MARSQNLVGTTKRIATLKSWFWKTWFVGFVSLTPKTRFVNFYNIRYNKIMSYTVSKVTRSITMFWVQPEVVRGGERYRWKAWERPRLRLSWGVVGKQSCTGLSAGGLQRGHHWISVKRDAEFVVSVWVLRFVWNCEFPEINFMNRKHG